jgi:protein CMS1
MISSSKKIQIAKLFAKHIKTQDQISTLKKGKHHAAVATPARLAALLDQLPNLEENIKYMIIDTHRDVKERSIFDIPETRKPLLDLIFKRMGTHIRSGKIKLVFLKQ